LIILLLAPVRVLSGTRSLAGGSAAATHALT
jgi:hypothetical protein